MAYRRTPAVEARLRRARAEILRAARHHLAGGGIAHLNVTSVAADAGVSVGTLYRHFPAKHDLLREIIDDICGHEREMVAKAAIEGPTAESRLVAAVSCFAERAVASGRVAYAVIAEPAPPEIEHHRLLHRRALAAIFAGIVADGVAVGEFPDQSADVAATAIVGAVSEVVVGPLSPTRRSDVDAAAVLASVVAHVRRSVAGRIDAAPEAPSPPASSRGRS